MRRCIQRTDKAETTATATWQGLWKALLRQSISKGVNKWNKESRKKQLKL